MAQRGKVLTFSAFTSRRRAAAPTTQSRLDLRTLVDDLSVLAIERPGTVRVFIRAAHQLRLRLAQAR